MSDENEWPEVGTRDFFEDAGTMLRESDTPHILICGYNKGIHAFRSCNVVQESIPWFRLEVNRYLDELEAQYEGGET